jgi:hypothetical protein
MKAKILVILLSIFIVSCASQSFRIDEARIKSVKSVAVVIFTIKAKIVYREDPREDDSDFSAWAANSSAFGIGENAANLAFPEFVKEINHQNLPFRVLSIDQMRSNAAFMALQPPSPEGTSTNQAKIAALAAISTNSAGTGPTGWIDFGLPEDWEDDGTALTGEEGEMNYIMKSIDALGVDGAIVIVDRGASFQCRLACFWGNGDSTMGSAFNAALVGRDGATILALNNWFDGSAHALMTSYVVNPLQRENLYSQHGVRMAKVFGETYREHTD